MALVSDVMLCALLSKAGQTSITDSCLIPNVMCMCEQKGKAESGCTSKIDCRASLRVHGLRTRRRVAE